MTCGVPAIIISVTEMIISASKMIICEPEMIVAVPLMIMCGREMAVCRMKMIGDVRSIIVGVMEKIGAFIKLIAWGMEITVPPSATITDGARIIVSETELIVTTVWLKGKTGRKEARENGGSELKRSACWVCPIVFPVMPPEKHAAFHS